jgi:hypothetical protein
MVEEFDQYQDVKMASPWSWSTAIITMMGIGVSDTVPSTGAYHLVLKYRWTPMYFADGSRVQMDGLISAPISKRKARHCDSLQQIKEKVHCAATLLLHIWAPGKLPSKGKEPFTSWLIRGGPNQAPFVWKWCYSRVVDAHLVEAVIGILSFGTINQRRRS